MARTIQLSETELTRLIQRVVNEQPDVYWDCVDGNCEPGGTQFPTEQDCQDSNCEERARPGGYGGRDKSMSAMDTQDLNEAPTPVNHDEVMKKIDKYCNGDESKMDTSELTGITKELIDTINGYCSAPIAESRRRVNEQRNITQWTGEEKQQLMNQMDDIHLKIGDIHTRMTTPSKPWNK